MLTKPRTRKEAYEALLVEITEHRASPCSTSAERVLMAACGYTYLQVDGYATRAALIEVAHFMRSIRPAVHATPAPWEDYEPTPHVTSHVEGG